MKTKTDSNDNSRFLKKKRLIEQLAHFLVDDQAAKSIVLQMDCQRPHDDQRPAMGKEWAALRGAATITSYATYEEAVHQLTELLESDPWGRPVTIDHAETKRRRNRIRKLNAKLTGQKP